MHFLTLCFSRKNASWRLPLAIVMLAMGTAFAQSTPTQPDTQTPAQTDGQTPSQSNQASSIRNEVVVSRIFAQEAKLVQTMRKYTPLVETYIQDMKQIKDLGSVPEKDQYFLGRLVLDQNGVNGRIFQNKAGASLMTKVLERLDKVYRVNYVPLGFMQLIFLNNNFDNQHYQLRYVRQQFFGSVRTLAFDVLPRTESKEPHFVGRIWVEDQDFNIVRINGTFEPRTRSNLYFHFDSWRLNLQPGLWLPAYVYTEESDEKFTMAHQLTMKGQVRLWGYDLKHSGVQSELTDIQIESATQVADANNTANEVVPVQSEHIWEREAEDNVIDRMERAGILAPAGGEVIKVLNTVVSNLEITNNLNIDPEVRCRVLLTTPLESFTVGHTIIISRGLLDVLPDEASLAMVLSHELGHIALGHRVNTKYGFVDRMLFPDENIFKEIEVAHKEEEDQAADAKGLEILEKSPYKDKLANADLFLNALGKYSRNLPWLINSHFGDRLAHGNTSTRMNQLATAAAPAKNNDITQLPALPLGSRVKLDPWDDHIELQKSKPEALLSAQDKMSFEVTPMFPNLVRLSNKTEVATQGATQQQDK